jgi:acetoin utilization deacetylase AcuC-like enzyme
MPAQPTRPTVVWSPDTRLHRPDAEIWVGVRTEGTELPERVDRIVEATAGEGWELVEAEAHDDEVLLEVHDAGLLDHLETVHRRWLRSGIPELVGQDRVVPYMFATSAMLGDLPGRPPTAVHALAGWYCYDTMTLVGPGTWPAVRAAADCALSAAERVIAGQLVAYAVCRPPGHHVTRSGYGGSCYLNNAAIAAQALRRSGHDRVGVVDLDAHHGNGTASIFYRRGDVFYGSVHVDPGAGWFPHVVGFADETGAGEGSGTTLNLPLAPGAGDQLWVAAVARLATAVAEHRATALVVSLGVDAAVDDPESPLCVTRDGYAAAGRVLADLGLPSVLVQEGGYHLDSLGDLVTAVLQPFAATPTS